MTTALERLQSGYYNASPIGPGNPGGLVGEGAVRENWPKLQADLAEVAALGGGQLEAATAQAQAAAASAAAALNAPGTSATSATELTLGTGAKALALAQTDKAFALGQEVTVAVTADPAKRMIGVVTAFDAGTGAMTVDVEAALGAGTFAGWTVSLAGAPLNTTTDTFRITEGLVLAGITTQVLEGPGAFDDYEVPADTVVLRVVPSSGPALNGIDMGQVDGQYLILENRAEGGSDMALAAESETSASANRFFQPYNSLGYWNIPAGASAVLRYDAALGGGDGRWVIVSPLVAQGWVIRRFSDPSAYVTAGELGASMAPQVLTDAATVNWDLNAGFNAKVTLGGNRTIAAPTNAKLGMSYALEVLYDGAYTPALNGCFKFGLSGTPDFSAAAGKRDLIFAYCYDAETPEFRCSFNKDA